MTNQKIKDMLPLDAALAIFAALGLQHIHGEFDSAGYCSAAIGTCPGAVLTLTMRQEYGTPRGMFRARVSDTLGRAFWASDITGPSGNFSRSQTVAQAAKAITRRLLSGGKPEAYIAALRKRHAEKTAAVAYADQVPALFTHAVHGECLALGYPIPAGDIYTPANSSGAQSVSYTGAFEVKLYGRGMLPDVVIWGEGREHPAFVRINEGRDSISFATAAKICALVALDKQTRY